MYIIYIYIHIYIYIYICIYIYIYNTYTRQIQHTHVCVCTFYYKENIYVENFQSLWNNTKTHSKPDTEIYFGVQFNIEKLNLGLVIIYKS